MSNAELRQSLTALHLELDKLAPVDAPVKARMEHLIADIERQVIEPQGEGLDGLEHGQLEHGQTAQQKLPTLIEQFEAEHPQVTERLNHLMVALSGMGI